MLKLNKNCSENFLAFMSTRARSGSVPILNVTLSSVSNFQKVNIVRCRKKGANQYKYQDLVFATDIPAATLNPNVLRFVLHKPSRPKGYFQFEAIINVILALPLHLNLVYIRTLYCWFFFSAGIDFRHDNLTSLDVRFWHLKSVTALKGTNTIKPMITTLVYLLLLLSSFIQG